MSTMSKPGLAGCLLGAGKVRRKLLPWERSSQWLCRDPSSCRSKGVVEEGDSHFGHDRSPGVALVLYSSRVLLKRPHHGDG